MKFIDKFRYHWFRQEYKRVNTAAQLVAAVCIIVFGFTLFWTLGVSLEARGWIFFAFMMAMSACVAAKFLIMWVDKNERKRKGA